MHTFLWITGGIVPVLIVLAGTFPFWSDFWNARDFIHRRLFYRDWAEALAFRAEVNGLEPVDVPFNDKVRFFVIFSILYGYKRSKTIAARLIKVFSVKR